MKTIITDSFKQLIADRYLFILVCFMILLAVTFSIIIGLSIHSSDFQLVSHYTAFGTTGMYRDQWYYLLAFILFQFVAAGLHAVIAVRMLVVKGRSFAIAVVWTGVVVLLLGLSTAMSLINLNEVWNPFH